MSPLKLNGSTSGFVALDAPAAAGSNTLVLPTGNGSNGQVLTTNGSGSLSWSTVTSSQWTTTGSDIYYTTGKVLVGTSTSRSWLGIASGLQVESTNYNNASISQTINTNDSEGVFYGFIKSRGTSNGSNTIVQNNDNIANIYFTATDGNAPVSAARIQAAVDGTPGSGDMPGRLVFYTTPDGSGTPQERMRITSAGSLTIGTTDELPGTNNVNGAAFYRGEGLLQLTRDGDGLTVNRKTTDGKLIILRQDGTEEGNISVSGTTVSYNGAHLSRYSQLPSGAEREEILRGSVLSNIDEMCEWGEEDNEQLNRMKVSDVEGDKNVSGVFQAWDDDDDTYINDFYCAMTGDFIIRIAEGVTVERGDLLMSAGDGTAKPQDDDIIRSKTIAKVTSTHVTCTYDDGSYCVPCVLMAC